MKHFQLFIFITFASLGLQAQLPLLEIEGFIQSDSLSGVGLRNVVADANGILMIDSNTVTSSLIELRDSTGDLKFRLDADQCLFQMFNDGDTVFMIQSVDSFLIDTTALRQSAGLDISGATDLGKTRQKLTSNDARFKELAIELRAALNANFTKINDAFGIDIRLPALNIVDLSYQKFSGNEGEVISFKSFQNYFIGRTDPVTGRLTSITNVDPHFDIAPGDAVTINLDQNGVAISAKLESIAGDEMKDFSSTCETVKTDRIDRDGGNDTETTYTSGNGNTSTRIGPFGSFTQGNNSSTEVNDGGVAVTQNNKQTRVDRDGAFIGDDNTQSRDITKDGDEYEDSGNGNKVTVTADPNANTINMGTAKVTAGAFCPPSDLRFKKEVKNLTSPLDQLLRLRPTSYFYRNERMPQGVQYGFIAQEVQKILPSLVTTFGGSRDESIGPDPYLTVNYIGLIPLLTKGIQDLEQQNRNQNHQIAQLKLENIHVEELEAEVQSLRDLIKTLSERVRVLEGEDKELNE